MTNTEPENEPAAGREDELSLKEQLVRTKRQLRETESELELRRTEVVQANQRILELLESRSWRVTAPLRALSTLLRKGGSTQSIEYWPPTNTPPPGPEVGRLYSSFDMRLDRQTRRTTREFLGANPGLRQQLVSVILPTYNRAGLLPEAIMSVIAQTHVRWELLVVDDGSTDSTPRLMEGFAHDPRIRYLPIEKSGVGIARNHGLDHATGEWVAFLDSDNAWDAEYLELMVGGLTSAGAQIGYSAVSLIEAGEVTGFRGDPFDFDECLVANYVDLNSLVVHRSLIDQGHRFDPQVRRTSDWDFLLSMAWEVKPVYLPFLGVRYQAGEDPSRITTAEPWLFRTVVQERHRRRSQARLGEPETFEFVLRSISLDIAIRTAAHHHERFNWGDHYFAVGLAQALERRGHSVTVSYSGEELDRRPDVQIVLRGLALYPPTEGAVNVLWSISHPDETEFVELLQHDVAAVASRPYASFLQLVLPRQVEAVLQATDRARFFPRSGMRSGNHMLFVGNSRDVYRPAIKFALDSSRELMIYGSGWEGLVPDGVVHGDHLSGDAVGDQYAQAGAVLNDHWDSMKDYAYISNRIYDVIASGGVPVSDTFPDLVREFGDAVETFTTVAEFDRAVDDAVTRRTEADRMDVALHLLNHHSLDERAGEILELVYEFMGAAPSGVVDKPSDPEDTLRVTVISRSQDHQVLWPDDVLSRVVSPLTTDLPDTRVRVDLSGGAHGNHDPTDALVVDVAALIDPETRGVVDRYREQGTPVFLDAPHGLGGVTVPDGIAAVWTSGTARDDPHENSTIIEDTLDPRLWRTYRRATTRTPGPVRVFLDTLTLGDEALDAVRTEIARMWDESPGSMAMVVVVRDRRTVPAEPWLETVELPTSFVSSAEVARWIRDQGRMADIALVVDTGRSIRLATIAWMQSIAMGLPVLVVAPSPLANPLTGELMSMDRPWHEELTTWIGNTEALDTEVERARRREPDLWNRRSSRLAGQRIVASILHRA